MTVTLEQLRDRVFDRIEFVTGSSGEGFVSRTELNGYINDSASELHEVLVVRYEDHFTSPFPTTFSLTGTDYTYQLPSDFFKISGVDVSDGGTWIPLRRFFRKDRAQWQSPSAYSGDRERRYAVMGNYITLEPSDDCAGDYRFLYVPKWIPLSASTEPLPKPMEQWAEYIIVDAGIKCLAKEESDTSALSNRKAELSRRIEAAATNRDVEGQEFIGSTGWGWDW